MLEDDAGVRDIMHERISELGYDTATAGGVDEALEIPATRDIDLVLSDVVLRGGISGPEFVGDLAKRDPHMAFVFMSGYPLATATAGKPLPCGAQLLTNPFGQAAVAEALRTALERARHRLTG